MQHNFKLGDRLRCVRFGCSESDRINCLEIYKKLENKDITFIKNCGAVLITIECEGERRDIYSWRFEKASQTGPFIIRNAVSGAFFSVHTYKTFEDAVKVAKTGTRGQTYHILPLEAPVAIVTCLPTVTPPPTVEML